MIGVSVEPYRNEWSEAFTTAEAMAMEGLAAFTEMGQPTGYEEAEGFDAFVVARDKRDMLGFGPGDGARGVDQLDGRRAARPAVQAIGAPAHRRSCPARCARPRGTHLAALVEVNTPGRAFLAALGVPRAGAAQPADDPPGGVTRPATLRFEGERAKALEAIYVTPDVVAQREEVLRRSTPAPGSGWWTSGPGPGCSRRRSRSASAPTGGNGIDVSPDMLAIAGEAGAGAGAAEVGARGAAASRTAVRDGPFDAAVCTQVYEYVADMPLALGRRAGCCGRAAAW